MSLNDHRGLKHKRQQGNIPSLVAAAGATYFRQTLLSLQQLGRDDETVRLKLWGRPPKVLVTTGTGIYVVRRTVRLDGSRSAQETFDDGVSLVISFAEMAAASAAQRYARGTIDLMLSDSFDFYNDTDVTLDDPSWEIETAYDQVAVTDPRRVCP